MRFFWRLCRPITPSYKYKIAQPDDLLAVSERVSGQEIDTLFETWIEK